MRLIASFMLGLSILTCLVLALAYCQNDEEQKGARSAEPKAWITYGR